ncbi:MAG: hypothetical protein WDM96_11405 [Lacunisphaera sp.]
MKLSRLAPAVLLLAGLPPALAQQAPASAAADTSDKTVVLSPFEVHSGDEGYGSANSTGASRIARADHRSVDLGRHDQREAD